jgi:hypothetical protein
MGGEGYKRGGKEYKGVKGWEELSKSQYLYIHI